jgi:hypothetical protein
LSNEQRGCLEQLIKAGDLTLLSLLKGYSVDNKDRFVKQV